MIELKNVNFRYLARQEWSLRNISLKIERGEFVLLCGTNGSGKSSLLRLLNGLIPHFYEGELQGQVYVDNLNTVAKSTYELFNRVALLAQNPEAQFFSPTVRRELAFGLESLNLPRLEIESRLAEIVKRFELFHLLDLNPNRLSSGEQQRVLLAALIALRPTVLVLDEPFAALDYPEVLIVRRELEKLNQAGTTVIVAEQRLDTLIGGQGVQRCLLMDKGELIADGSVRQVFGLTSNPQLLPPLPALFNKSGLPDSPFDFEEALKLSRDQHLEVVSRGVKHKIGRPVLELKDVTLQYPSANYPSLTIEQAKIEAGVVTALVGRNGAGKTTLARHCIGLLPSTKGQSQFNNIPIYHKHRRFLGKSEYISNLKLGQAGFMFHNPDNQLFLPTVRAELEFGQRMLKRQNPDWLSELIDRLNLEPLLERNPLTLSGGEKKLVTFASTLSTCPELLALDEPTAGLDYLHQEQVIRLIETLAQHGHTILFITHNLEIAAEIASDWLVIAEHRIAATSSVLDLQKNLPLFVKFGLELPVALRLASQLNQPYLGGKVWLERHCT